MTPDLDRQNPYAPPTAPVLGVAGAPVMLADIGSRFGAAVLDTLVSLVVIIPLIAGMIAEGASGSGVGPAIGGILSLVVGIGFLIYTIRLVNENGQTVGKKMVGIKVVRADGSKASLGRIFWLRNVVNALPQMIPFIGNFYGIIDHVMVFGEKRQCLHDRIADTIVVRA